MKAIGYSTIQLMNQIAISFLPVIITGVVGGGVLGILFTNPYAFRITFKCRG